MTSAEIVLVSFVVFFLALALLVFLRLLLRKGPPDWVEYRIGVYVERKPEREPAPPTSYVRTHSPVDDERLEQPTGELD